MRLPATTGPAVSETRQVQSQASRPVADLPPISAASRAQVSPRPGFKMGGLFEQSTRAAATCLLAMAIGFGAPAQGAPVVPGSSQPRANGEVIVPRRGPDQAQSAHFFVPQSRTIAVDAEVDPTGSANYSLDNIRLDDQEGPRNNNSVGLTVSHDNYQVEARVGNSNGVEHKLGVTKMMGEYSVGVALQQLNNNPAPVATVETNWDLPITNHLVGGLGLDAGLNMQGQPYAKAELGLSLDIGFAGISVEGRGSIDTDQTEKLAAGLRIEQGDWAATGTITHVSDEAHRQYNDPGDLGFKVMFQYRY